MDEQKKTILVYILDRLKEASTWNGVAAALVAAGWNVPSGIMQTAIIVLTMVCGVLGIILKG